MDIRTSRGAGPVELGYMVVLLDGFV